MESLKKNETNPEQPRNGESLGHEEAIDAGRTVLRRARRNGENRTPQPGDLKFMGEGITPRVLMDDGKTWARKGGRVERNWNRDWSKEPVSDEMPASPEAAPDGVAGLDPSAIGVGERAEVFGDDPDEAALLAMPDEKLDAELERNVAAQASILNRTTPRRAGASGSSDRPTLYSERTDLPHSEPPRITDSDSSPRRSDSNSSPRRTHVSQLQPAPAVPKKPGGEVERMMNLIHATDPENMKKMAKARKEAKRAAKAAEKIERLNRRSDNPDGAFEVIIEPDDEPYMRRRNTVRGAGFERETFSNETINHHDVFRVVESEREPVHRGTANYRGEKQNRRLKFFEKFKNALKDFKNSTIDVEHFGETRNERAERLARENAEYARSGHKFDNSSLDAETRRDFGYQPYGGHYFSHNNTEPLERPPRVGLENMSGLPFAPITGAQSETPPASERRFRRPRPEVETEEAAPKPETAEAAPEHNAEEPEIKPETKPEARPEVKPKNTESEPKHGAEKPVAKPEPKPKAEEPGSKPKTGEPGIEASPKRRRNEARAAMPKPRVSPLLERAKRLKPERYVIYPTPDDYFGLSDYESFFDGPY